MVVKFEQRPYSRSTEIRISEGKARNIYFKQTPQVTLMHTKLYNNADGTIMITILIDEIH